MTQTGAKRCQVYLAGVKTRAAAGAEQTAASSSATGTATAWSSMTLDDGSPGTNSIRYLGIYSGASSVSAASTNLTTNGTSASIDFGNYVFFTMRETTPSGRARRCSTIATAITDGPGRDRARRPRRTRTTRSASVTATGGGVATRRPARPNARTLAGASAPAGGVAVARADEARTPRTVASHRAAASPCRAGRRRAAHAKLRHWQPAAGSRSQLRPEGRSSSGGRRGRRRRQRASASSPLGSLAAPPLGRRRARGTQTTSRRSAVTATGGGVAVVDGARGVDNRDASIAATGGGAVSLSVAAARQLAALLATGGGLATLDATTGRPRSRRQAAASSSSTAARSWPRTSTPSCG